MTARARKIAGRQERSEAALSDLNERLEGIDNLDVQVVRAKPLEGAATTRADDGTLLFRALNNALANVPPNRLSGVFLITDGQVHDVPKQVSQLGFDAPVHALLNGAPDEFDRRIKIINAPRFGLVGSEAEILLSIDEFGRRADGATDITQLTIRREGQPDETRPVLIGDRIKVPFSFPHAGPNIVELQLGVAPGELTNVNNKVVISAEGVRENLRVLLVSGEPHAGERTWRNLLKSDAAVDLVHFTILRPPEKQDGTPIHQLSLIEFPTRELFSEKLNDFDLIIFDRYQRRGVLPMLYLDNIARYVADGGAVLIAAGEDFAMPRSLYRTPLYQVIPGSPTGRVHEEPFRAKVTDIGRRHPVTRDLDGAGILEPGQKSADVEPSWGRWFRIVEVAQSTGHAVMNGARDKPLLVLDRKGEGRVALLTSDHAWLWARGYEGGGPHTQLLRRLAHWLMKEPDLEEEFLALRPNGMTLRIERRTMGDEIGEVTITGPDGAARQVSLTESEPGKWVGTLSVDLPGLYRAKSPAEVKTLEAIAHVGLTNSREMAEVITADKVLQPILAGTKAGHVYLRRAGTSVTANSNNVDVPRVTMLSDSAVMHGRGWLGLKERNAYLTTGVKVYPVFNGPFALAALLALLALAWYREGR